MNETPKNKRGWRILRRILITLAVLATLIAAFYAEEDWRGKRAWESYKHAAEARGERFDLVSVVPPPVPDDQNFFFAPIVAEALKADSDSTGSPNRMNFNIYCGNSSLWPTNYSNWEIGRLTDLGEWQHYFRMFDATPEGKTNGFPLISQPQIPAADVLLALSRYNEALDELREAAQRPFARMPVNYEDGFESAGTLLPWLANTKMCGQFLQLSIIAELQNNQPDKALDNVKLFLRLTDVNRNPRFMISDLVRIAMFHIVLEPIHQGITQHRWSDAQLAELERELAKENLLADFLTAINGEKVCAIDAFEKQRLTRLIKMVDDSSGTNKIVTVSLRWMPDAYFYQNELAYARMCDEFILPLVDLTNRTVSPAALRRNGTKVNEQLKHATPYNAQALMIFPALGKAVEKYAVIQADLDLARVACALERYRLAHGNYPETLDGLSPRFIDQVPLDIIGGQPLHYRRVGDGKYILYSVGWNGTDDGGRVVLRKGGSVDREKGDWVWQYPVE